MRFTKYHGTGNDFILMKEEDIYGEDFPALAKRLCHRRFGLGADGFMVASYSKTEDLKMQYFNQDGSEAPMCGNGLRCFGRFVHEEHMEPKKRFTVETLAGTMGVEILSAYDRIQISLDAPKEEVGWPHTKEPVTWDKPVSFTVGSRTYDVYVLFLGTLHGVVFTKLDVPEEDAKALCHHEFFPEAININFVKVEKNYEIYVKTYERGVGYTLSCGTGAMASAYMAHRIKGLLHQVLVKVDGGLLEVACEERIYLTGPAVKIAEGGITDA